MLKLFTNSAQANIIFDVQIEICFRARRNSSPAVIVRDRTGAKRRGAESGEIPAPTVTVRMEETR